MSDVFQRALSDDMLQYLQVKIGYDPNVVNDLSTSLAQITPYRGINIKSPIGTNLTPAKGDDSTDDTAAITAILNYAYQNSLPVLVPPGTYKITSTIVIDHNLTQLPSLHIIGMGNTFTTKDRENTAVFKGYNIADKRGIMEFTGRGVNQATGVTMEYIGFDMDYSSCGQLAFDLTVGDANVPTFRKCTFYGFNNILIRCGTAPDYTGYIFSCALFEQCYFNTNRYIDWDETTVLPKAQFGFCVAPEHLFVTHALANIWDSVTFSECNFLGSVYQYGTVNYRNCMWQIPGDYKLQIDVTNDARFNTTFLPDKTINCEIGIVVLGGRAHFYEPYFEDVRMCIATYKNGNGISSKIIVENPIANATLNTPATVSGTLQKPQYFLQTIGTNYTVDFVEIKGGSYSVGNQGGFQQGFVVNNIAQRLIVTNVAGVTEDLIVDNYSRTKHFEGINASDNNGTLIELTATGTASVYGKLLNFDGFLNYFNVPCHAIIKEISVILPSTETSGYLGFVQFDSFTNTPGTVYTDCNAGNVHTNISFTDTNYITTDTIGSSVRYAVKNYPDIVTNQYQRLWYLKKGKKLGVYTTLSDNASVTIKVKLLV
jgi:hypothetical protein